MLGSGDLFTARDCLDMLAQTGVDGVSIARGAIGNPWIFEPGPRLGGRPGRSCRRVLRQQRAIIAEHYRLAEELYGPKHTPSRMRKFGIKYARLHPQAEQVRDAFVAVGSAERFSRRAGDGTARTFSYPSAGYRSSAQAHASRTTGPHRQAHASRRQRRRVRPIPQRDRRIAQQSPSPGTP